MTGTPNSDLDSNIVTVDRVEAIRVAEITWICLHFAVRFVPRSSRNSIHCTWKSSEVDDRVILSTRMF